MEGMAGEEDQPVVRRSRRRPWQSRPRRTARAGTTTNPADGGRHRRRRRKEAGRRTGALGVKKANDTPHPKVKAMCESLQGKATAPRSIFTAAEKRNPDLRS